MLLSLRFICQIAVGNKDVNSEVNFLLLDSYSEISPCRCKNKKVLILSTFEKYTCKINSLKEFQISYVRYSDTYGLYPVKILIACFVKCLSLDTKYSGIMTFRVFLLKSKIHKSKFHLENIGGPCCVKCICSYSKACFIIILLLNHRKWNVIGMKTERNHRHGNVNAECLLVQ